MTTQIDFRTLPANVPVLCIPRVYANISESRIRRIFDDLGMGTLDRIDIVSKNSDKGEKFNRVFVHFYSWNDSENANTARERLLNGKEIKIIYDDPWFWKISAYREPERKQGPQQPQQPSSGGWRRASIAFDSDDDKSSKPIINREFRRDERPRRRDDSRERPRRRDDSRERPRRRDDSRERPRNHYNANHKVNNAFESKRQDDPRKDKPNYRSYTTGYQAGHPNNSEKQSPQETPVRKFVETETLSNSPRRDCDDNPPAVQTPIDYGNIIPPLKKRASSENKRLVIEADEKESK